VVDIFIPSQEQANAKSLNAKCAMEEREGRNV
jgi:hypothetical protein